MKENLVTQERETKKQNKDCNNNRNDSAKNCDKKKGGLLEGWITYRKKNNKSI